MRSRASIRSHPLHPMLVAFPVAFLWGCFIFDILSILLDHPAFWQTGYHLQLAGLVSTLLAAVPGMIDYLRIIPPESSAKKRGARHALLNGTHFLIFSLACWLRTGDYAQPVLVLSLEAAGVIILSIAGWLGGTLVFRNQIGVDHRYAESGKWKESFFDASNEMMDVAAVEELRPNQMKLLHIGEKRIVLGRTEEGYVAFDDHCTHRGASLADGTLSCGTVQCPWHGSRFDVLTGTVVCGPADKPIHRYPVTEKDGRVYLHPG